MRTLTATICLTLVLLLGSAGVSWGAEFEEHRVSALDQAQNYLLNRNIQEGINQREKPGKSFVVTIGEGQTIVEALCDAVQSKIVLVDKLLSPSSDPSARMSDLLSPSLDPSTRMSDLKDQLFIHQGDGDLSMFSSEGSSATLESKYKIQVFEINKVDGKNYYWVREISIKSLSAELTCFDYLYEGDSGTEGYEFNYKYKSDKSYESLAKLIEELRKKNRLIIFTSKNNDETILEFSIIFMSRVSNWE